MKHKMTPEQIENSMKLADLLINHPKDVPFDLGSMGACAMKHYAGHFGLKNSPVLDSEMGGSIEETFGLASNLFGFWSPRGAPGSADYTAYPGEGDEYYKGQDDDPVALGKHIKTLVAENAIMVPE